MKSTERTVMETCKPGDGVGSVNMISPPEGSVDLVGSKQITADFPQSTANKPAVTSNPLGSGSDENGVSQGTNESPDAGSMKALSLKEESGSVGVEGAAMESSTEEVPGVPRARLSWGEVTQIPDGAALGRSHPEYEKHGLPMGGASAGGIPYQVRSTQHPYKPLVRRPTPMAIKVPRSVLDKASKSSMAASLEEEEDEEEEGGVPVSLKETTNVDVLVVEDVEEEVEDIVSPGPVHPTDLPVQQNASLDVVEASRDTGSPTIVVLTDIGKQLSQEEAEIAQDEEPEEEEEVANEVEEDENSRFLSESYEKKPDPPVINSHVQTVPHQPRKLVRRQTPITLELPKNLKDMMKKENHQEILEEEEEEEEEEEQQQFSETKPANDSLTPETDANKPRDTDTIIEPSLSSKDYGTTSSYLPTSTAKDKSGSSYPAPVSDQPDILDSLNFNNNNRDSPALDLVASAPPTSTDHENEALATGKVTTQNNFRKSASDDGRLVNQNSIAAKPRQNHFRKSASADKDGDKSPSSARRKVGSSKHTKILTRQLTPLQIDVPKSILKEFMKSPPPDGFLEEEEEES